MPNGAIFELADDGSETIAFKAIHLPKHMRQCVGHWKRDGKTLAGRITVVFTAEPNISSVGTVKASIADAKFIKVLWQDTTKATKSSDGVWRWEGKGEGLWAKLITPGLLQPILETDADWMEKIAERSTKSVVRVERGNALGTGFVVASDEGRHLILTNRHVIFGSGESSAADRYAEIYVETPAKQKIAGRIAALPRDPKIDLAILLVDPSSELQVLGPIASYSSVKVAEPVVAIGHPLGLDRSVAQGIISGKPEELPPPFDRMFEGKERYLQTSAAINHGNSGGPLVNRQGRVVGVNTLTFGPLGAQGIGFAVRADIAIQSSEWTYSMDIDDLMRRIPCSDEEYKRVERAKPSKMAAKSPGAGSDRTAETRDKVERQFREQATIDADRDKNPADSPSKSFGPFAGTWIIKYAGGPIRHYTFDAVGHVLFAEEKRRGKMYRSGDEILLDFQDGKLERVKLSDNEIQIDHFSPKSSYPKNVLTTGIGSRLK